MDAPLRRRHLLESFCQSTPSLSHNSRLIVIEQMFFVPQQDLAEDLQLVTAWPLCVRNIQYMYAIECARKLALMSPCFIELLQIDVYHIYLLNIRYRLLVECHVLIVSERLLCLEQKQGTFPHDVFTIWNGGIEIGTPRNSFRCMVLKIDQEVHKLPFRRCVPPIVDSDDVDLIGIDLRRLITILLLTMERLHMGHIE